MSQLAPEEQPGESKQDHDACGRRNRDVAAAALGEDDGKPVGRRMVPDDADLGIEAAESTPNVIRPRDDDTFYRSDDAKGEKLPPLPPGKDVVTCLAGCNGPRGSVVYRK